MPSDRNGKQKYGRTAAAAAPGRKKKKKKGRFHRIFL